MPSNRKFGISSNLSGLQNGMIVNTISKSETIESAEARDEKGRVIDIAVYGRLFVCCGHECVCHVGAIPLAGNACVRHARGVRHNTSDKAAEKVFPDISVHIGFCGTGMELV